MRVFHTIQRQKKLVLRRRSILRHRLPDRQQILDPQRPALPHHRQHALVHIRLRHPRQLLARLRRNPYIRHPALRNHAFQPLVMPIPCHKNMIQSARSRADRLLHRMKTV